MNRFQLAALAIAAAATACGRSDGTDAPRLTPESVAAGADIRPATGPGAVTSGNLVLDFEETEPQYTVSTQIDPAITAFDPALAALIAQAARGEVEIFSAQARADEKLAAAEAAANGGETWFRPYQLEIVHDVTAGTADIISLKKVAYVYTGGAHPNTAMAGSIYTRTSPEPVKAETILRDMTAFREAVIAGLIEEKMQRGWEPSQREIVAGEVRDLLTAELPGAAPWSMVSNIVLEPSDEPGKFGGITVLYSPYDVGAYAEGPYTVTVASAALQPMLAADWKDRFGGQPLVAPED